MFFPVHLDITEYYNQAHQHSTSLLNYTLLKMFLLTEEEKELLWRTYQSRVMGELDFHETIWNTLKKLCIFKEDSLEIFLSNTIGIFIDVFNTRDLFNKLMSEFVRLAEGVLGRPLYERDMELSKYVSIFAESNIVVHKIHLAVFDIPVSLTKPLQKAGYNFLTEIVKLSESEIVRNMGLNNDSLLLIKNLWKIRPWILCASDMIANLERNQNVFPTVNDMVTAALTSSKKKRSEAYRDAKITTDYFMKLSSTLEDVGQKFNLSRERIRQVFKKMWKKLASPSYFKRLSLLWIVIYNNICDNNGLIYINELALSIQGHFFWEKAPETKQLKELIKLDNSLIYHEGTRLVYLAKWDCACCGIMRRKLLELVDQNYSSTNIKPWNTSLRSICDNYCSSSHILFTPNLVLLAKLLLGKNRDQIKIEGDDIYLLRDWEIKFGDSFTAIDDLMHFLSKSESE